MSIRNGWVVRIDTEDQEERSWWTGSAFSKSLHDAVFFATEADAHKVSKMLADPTALDFLHDPRPESAKTPESER
jgi:hypothetical protein